MLKSYLKKIFKIANQGDAREESYYSTLEALLKEAAKSFGKQKIHITTLSKSTEAGNPDFRIWECPIFIRSVMNKGLEDHIKIIFNEVCNKGRK